jgi:basic membrane protein A
VVDGTFEGGGTLRYDLANDGVGYATTGDHIPADILAEVETIKAGIISGNIVVPATAADFEAQFPGKYNLQPVGQQ